jgi:hypothetical protein
MDVLVPYSPTGILQKEIYTLGETARDNQHAPGSHVEERFQAAIGVRQDALKTLWAHNGNSQAAIKGLKAELKQAIKIGDTQTARHADVEMTVLKRVSSVVLHRTANKLPNFVAGNLEATPIFEEDLGEKGLLRSIGRGAVRATQNSVPAVRDRLHKAGRRVRPSAESAATGEAPRRTHNVESRPGRGPEAAARPTPPAAVGPNERTTRRLQAKRAEVQHARKDKRAEHAEARQEVDSAIKELSANSNPEVETTVKVIKKVPWLEQKWMQSYFMQPNHLGGWAARRFMPRFGRNAFTMHEFGQGEPRRNHRKDQRFRVVKEMKGFALPYIIGSNPPGSPTARNPYVPNLPSGNPRIHDPTATQSNRNDMLVMGADGKSSWAGGLLKKDRSAIAVGKDIAVIGIDARPVPRDTRAGRFAEGLLDTIGINRRRTPNDAARGLDAVTGIYDTRPIDIMEQTKKLNGIAKSLRELRDYATWLSSPTATRRPRHRPPIDPAAAAAPPHFTTPRKYGQTGLLS